MPKQARTGALMDVPKGVQRCAMPPTQAQTGAPRSAWGLQTPTDAVPGAMPPTQVQTGAPSTGHRNAKASALPDGRRRKRHREAQPNTRAPKPWTQNQTDAQYRAETSEQNWKQVQQAFLDGGRAAAPNPQRNQRTNGAEYLLDARHLGISRSLLDLRFREANGKTTSTFITETRLAEVKRRLRKTKQSIRGISRECGFANPNHLKNLFKMHFGMSMRDYRSAQPA